MNFDHERYAAIAEPHPMDDATATAEAQREATRKAETESRWLRDLIAAVGRRYAACTLDTFEPSTGPQTVALERLRAYAQAIEANIAAGLGVTLYGACGTGKDHLAVGLCRTAIEAGRRAVWIDAETMFGDLRGTFRDDAKRTEREVFRDLETVPLLAISDPIPQSGELTDYQSRAIRRIIGDRYANLRPTILTLNVASGEEARKRLGEAVYDRVKGSSLAIHCNWPSYRQRPQ